MTHRERLADELLEHAALFRAEGHESAARICEDRAWEILQAEQEVEPCPQS